MRSEDQTDRFRFEDCWHEDALGVEHRLSLLISESCLSTLESRLLELEDRARYYGEPPTLETLVELKGYARLIRRSHGL